MLSIRGLMCLELLAIFKLDFAIITVNFELVTNVGRIIALFSLAFPLTRSEMLPQKRFCYRLLATHALKHAFAIVYFVLRSLVSSEDDAIRKSGVAQLAAIRPLFRMMAKVGPQVLGFEESKSTACFSAWVRSVIRVGAHVDCQIPAGNQYFPAD